MFDSEAYSKDLEIENVSLSQVKLKFTAQKDSSLLSQLTTGGITAKILEVTNLRQEIAQVSFTIMGYKDNFKGLVSQLHNQT